MKWDGYVTDVGEWRDDNGQKPNKARSVRVMIVARGKQGFMNRTSYWAFLFLGLLLLMSDTMAALGQSLMESEQAAKIGEVIGTALDSTGESSNWLSRLNGGEDQL